ENARSRAARAALRDRVLLPLRPHPLPPVPLLAGARRRPRPFRLPAASVVAPAAVLVANEILLFAGWAVVWKLIAAILMGLALRTLSTLTDRTERSLSLDWHGRSGSCPVCSAWPRSRTSARSMAEAEPPR